METIRKKSSPIGCFAALLVVVALIIIFRQLITPSVLTLVGGIIVLIILGNAIPAVGTFFLLLIDVYYKLSRLLILAILPSVLFHLLYKSSSSWPIWLQTLVLIVSGILLATGLWLLMLEKNRAWLLKKTREFKWTDEFGIMIPLAYVYNMMLFSLLFFGSLTYFFVNQGWLVWIGESGQQLTLEQINDFYLWHLVNTLPFKIPETVHWTASVTYENPNVGWMLVLFKSVAIVPVVNAFTWYWRDFGKVLPTDNAAKPIEGQKEEPKTKTVKRVGKPKLSAQRTTR